LSQKLTAPSLDTAGKFFEALAAGELGIFAAFDRFDAR
jgi:hypothetical protein